MTRVSPPLRPSCVSGSDGATTAEMLVIAGIIVGMLIVTFQLFGGSLGTATRSLGRCVSGAASGSFAACGGTATASASGTPPGPSGSGIPGPSTSSGQPASGILSTLGQAASTGVQWVWSGVVSGWNTYVVQPVVDTWQTVTQVWGYVRPWAQAGWNGVTWVWNTGSSWAQTAWTSVSPWVKPVWNYFVWDPLVEILRPLAQDASWAWNIASSWVRTNWDTIKQNFPGSFDEAVRIAFNGIKNLTIAGWNQLVRDPIVDIWNTVKWAGSGITSAWNYVTGGTPDPQPQAAPSR